MRSLRTCCYLALLALLGVLMPVTVRSDEKPAEKPGKGSALDEMLKEKERPSRNGMLLRTTKAEIVETEGRKLLKVDWRMEYKGNRWPLIVRKPSITEPMGERTRLRIVARGRSGEAYHFDLLNSAAKGSYTSKKEWFIDIKKDLGTAEGAIEVPFDRLKTSLLKHFPDEFNETLAPDVYIRLSLDVEDRGEHLNLDAWTGFLGAPPIKVLANKW